MELLIEIIMELLIGGSLEGANDSSLPKGVRLGFLIFATLIYVVFTAFLYCYFLIWTIFLGK